MDGFASSGRVVVIAASNLLEKLDPALLRPGRFDRQVFVVPPDVKGRRGVLQVHTRDKPLEDVDLGLVAQQTSGLTGADLANICNEAAIFAARRGAKEIATRDFDARARAGDRGRAVQARAQRRTRSASSPSTRPATRSAASCCRRSTACTGSRSSRAGARSATR